MKGLRNLAKAVGIMGTISGMAEAQETNNVVLATMSDTQNQAELTMALPHPDGPIIVDVSQVALETQVNIMENLQICLQEGFKFADQDSSGQIDDLEVYDLREEGAYCSEIAKQEFLQAGADPVITEANTRIETAQAGQAVAQEQIGTANARIAAAKARQAAAQAKIEAITNNLMEGMRAQGG